MARLFQQGIVQRPYGIVLALFKFKINVGFPDQFRHVQLGLLNGQFVDKAGAVRVAELLLEIGEFEPGGTGRGVEFQELLVENAASIKVSQLQLYF